MKHIPIVIRLKKSASCWSNIFLIFYLIFIPAIIKFVDRLCNRILYKINDNYFLANFYTCNY